MSRNHCSSIAALVALICLQAIQCSASLSQGPLQREQLAEYYPDLGFVRALDRLDYIKENTEPYIVNSLADKWYSAVAPQGDYVYIEYEEDYPQYDYPDYDFEYYPDGDYEYIANLGAEEAEEKPGLSDLSDEEFVGLLSSLSEESLQQLSDWMTSEGNEEQLEKMLGRMENLLLEQLIDDIRDEQGITELIRDIEELGSDVAESGAAKARVVTLEEYEPSGGRLLDGSVEDASLYPFITSLGINPDDYQDLKRSYLMATKRRPHETYYIQNEDPYQELF